MMGRRAPSVRGAIIREHAGILYRRAREPDEAWRTGTVVHIPVPLAPKDTRRERRRLAGRQRCDTRVTPEAQFAFGCRDLHGVSAHAVHDEHRAAKRVLRAAAVVRLEARIAPRAGPYAWKRIDLRVGVRLFVTDECAMRRP